MHGVAISWVADFQVDTIWSGGGEVATTTDPSSSAAGDWCLFRKGVGGRDGQVKAS